jgi:apolipoprotein N-acyltransferase
VGDRALRLKRAAAGLALALGLALAFPFRAGSVQLDLGLGAGWLALVGLAAGLPGQRPRAAFAWTTAAATAGYAAVLFWLYVVVTVHGQAPAVFGGLAVLGVALALGIHAGLAGALVAWLAPAGGARALAALPAAWVATEHLRSFDLFGGFPWAYLGHSAHANGPLLELAALGGAWGLSFLLAAFAALLAARRWRAALALLCGAHALGFALGLRARAAAPPEATLRAGIVQASIPQDIKWDPALAREHFAAHVELTRLAAAAGPLDLVVWPEASVPVLLEVQPEYRDQVVALAAEVGAPLVLGGTGLDPEEDQGGPRVSNSAFVVDPARGLVDRYDKTHLVPFGEYVPLRSVLGHFSAIATGLAGLIDLTPGAGPRVLRLEGARVGAHAPSALICYEVIYPGLVRDAVRGGARLLLNLTNDAWYGRTSAPHQFLAIAALRSAEHGLPMLRAANTGVSAVIDAGGIVLRQTPIFERQALVGEVPPARHGPTPYTRWGGWVVWASWGILLGLGGMRVVGRRGRPGQGGAGSAARAARA